MSVPGLNLQPLSAEIAKYKQQSDLKLAQAAIDNIVAKLRANEQLTVDPHLPAEAVKMLDEAFVRVHTTSGAFRYWTLLTKPSPVPGLAAPQSALGKRPRPLAAPVELAGPVPPYDVEQSLIDALRSSIDANKAEINSLTDAIENATEDQRPMFEAKLSALTKEQQQLRQNLKLFEAPPEKQLHPVSATAAAAGEDDDVNDK